MIQKENWMISDLHIHSRFSQACSRNITFENLVKWAKIKGLHLLGTGDFTHPVWIEEIKEKLEDRGKGFYYLDDFPFIISGEISLIYTQGRGRRMHLVILVPSIEVAEKINGYLDTKGRRDYDGRPIFKIPAGEFVEDMMKISKEIEVIPAHIWTPWFSLFGSKSGFDSMKEAFGDQFDNVHAIETGMSSDPEMNWKIKDLENKSIVSFSDAHSFWPFRMGREATIFQKCDSYKEVIRQIRENDFIATIETDPAYGKYHWDGHRNCDFSCDPKKTRELDGNCPKCGKPLVIGVEYRVEELTNEESNHQIKKPFYTLLPLHELITLNLGFGMQSKKVWDVYNNLIREFGNEFNILLDVSRDDFVKADVDCKLIALILKNRKGNVTVKPGFDGEYGVAQVGDGQETLF
ncbi:DNA helicase UvrD [Candidatus Pacearchaeota archaeon]|nr:DNA helicase UvrD [Candidatus Pacearchaeota archaeon]